MQIYTATRFVLSVARVPSIFVIPGAIDCAGRLSMEAIFHVLLVELSYLHLRHRQHRHFTENRGLKWKPRDSKIPRCIAAHVDPTLAAHQVATESFEVHGFILLTAVPCCSHFS